MIPSGSSTASPWSPCSAECARPHRDCGDVWHCCEMNSADSPQAIVLARKLIAASRITIGLLAVGIVLADGIAQFTENDPNSVPPPSLRIEVSRFLNGALLPLALCTAILMLSVFASVYVERLASELPRFDGAQRPQEALEGDVVVSDDVWRR